MQIFLQYLKKEDIKIVHFLHAAEHQNFLQVEIIVFYGSGQILRGPAMFIVTCFLTQPDCTNFQSEHCNTIIKLQLCGERLPLRLFQVDVFQENEGILQQIILGPSSKPEKA